MDTGAQKPTISRRIDGNIFVIVGAARSALKRAGMDTADEMSDLVAKTGSYDEALQVVMRYVEFR